MINIITDMISFTIAAVVFVGIICFAAALLKGGSEDWDSDKF